MSIITASSAKPPIALSTFATGVKMLKLTVLHTEQLGKAMSFNDYKSNPK